MRGFPRGGGGIKSRLGVAPGRRNIAQTNKITVVGGGIQRRLGGLGGGGITVVGRGGGIKSRLGAGGARGGIGINNKAKRSVAALAIGEILDARQKINLNKLQSGRIGDARQKIEEKRRKNSIIDGKIKNLRIITPVAEHFNSRMSGGGGFMNVNNNNNAMNMMSGMNMRSRPQQQQQYPQGLISRSEREAMNYQGAFRSADTFSYTMRQGPIMSTFPQSQQQPLMTQQRITRSVAGNNSYPPGIRIAPSQQDDFVLTRTIRNPTAAPISYGGGGMMRSDYMGRSPPQGVARVAPSVQYPSHGTYNRSSLRDQAMDMDDDDMYDQPPPVRRSEYSTSSDSQSRILVSNLQPSVTADDIVELFSDIGPLTGARMTASGQAEVTYSRKTDAVKAIEAYHNRLLDGSAMRVFLDSGPPSRPSTSNAGSYTALKSASGASMKLPGGGKSSGGLKIQPDIQAIHKVLFNPGSSATRGLFKGGQ